MLQKTIEALRERPHEDKRAVATAVALTVVVLLALIWSYFFFAPMAPSGEMDLPAQTASAAVAQ